MKPYLYSLIAVAAACGFASAQTTAYTTPVGYTTVDLPGKTGSAKRLQLSTQQLIPSGGIQFAGTVDSFSGTTLNDADGTWAAGAFVNPTPPSGYPNYSHVVEITSGPLLGTITWITGSAVGSLTTYDNISAAGTANYRVIKCFTIGSLLGNPPSSSVMLGSTSATNADNFLIFNSTTNSYTTFYYKNAGATGGTGWRSSASNSIDVSSVAIHPSNSGLVFQRNQATAGSLVITGDVKTGATDVVIRGKGGTGPAGTSNNILNIIQALHPVDKITLGTSGLYTGSQATGLLGGSSATAADTIQVFNAATNSYTTYYYKSSGATGGTGWRSSASNSIDVSATVLPSVSSILITRKGAAAPDFTWEIPQAWAP